ncbi:hypothetical protein ACFVYJ_03695 [Pontibacter sp. JAM-7]|uniref:hypothetical protein n=1 Tax=Pontibacter sp. JAM-7 TaxID=3366581 RepID=UPI003AF87028
MIEIAIVTLLCSLFIGLHLFSRHKSRLRLQAQTQIGITQLTAVLDLIQQLQRHRGLCASLSDDNRMEQQQLSREIDRLWQPLQVADYCGKPSRVRIQHQHWQQIRQNPENSFMPHSELIEKLLHELTEIADYCALTAENSLFDQEALWQNLIRRPHHAESLARLRGLGAKSAREGRCQASVRVQLQYLLQQMKSDPIANGKQMETERLVSEQILQPDQISIDPGMYFSQLSRLIDEQIQITRTHLQQL